MTACSQKEQKQKLAQSLEIDLKEAEILEDEDSHGGFHGDGHRYVALRLEGDAKNAAEKAMVKSENWSALPFDDTLHTLVYGKKTASVSREPCVVSDSQKALFPEVENGYYYFRDRQDWNAGTGKEDLLERASLNFTIALYDAENGMLYYYEFDS